MSIPKNIISRAKKLAQTSLVCRGKHGALLCTSNHHVITSACNVSWWGHGTKKLTIHAEEMLISKGFKLKALDRFGDKKLYVLVVRYRPGDGKLGSSKPCQKCQKLLEKAGVKVFYSDEVGEIKEL
jgi:cytidine deaminase